MNRIVNRFLDLIGIRTSSKPCKKCGCRRYKVVFDGGYTDYIVCACCGTKVENSERFRI